jgi:type VI secretion system protein ImpA
MTATPKPFYKELVAAIDGSQEALRDLEAFSDERFGEFAPSYRGLRTSLDEVEHVGRKLLEKKLEQDPDPPELETGDDAMEAEGDATGGEPESGTGGPAGGGGLSAEPTSRGDAADRVATAARFIRQADPTDPAPYLMLRGFRWGELRRDDERIDPRLLAAPPTRVRTRLKGLLLDGKWEALVHAAEDVMATEFGRGWLDLQRYVLTGLDGLGPEYGAVRKAVRGALAELLRDRPELPELTLMDDAPTANRETRRWLQEEGIFAAFSEEAREELEAAREGRAAAPSARDVVARAREKLHAGQPRQAIELLLKGAEDTNTERIRFLRRSEASRIMVQEGLEAVAMPILREMLQTIEAHNLEEWEAGETIAQPLGLLYRCMKATGDPAGEMETLYLRVARLDPMQAIHFTGEAEADAEAEAAAATAAEAGADGAQG